MELYKEYLQEREDACIIYDDKGFATYKYLEDGIVYIVDLYVKKEHRKNHIASGYAYKIIEEAKSKDCKFCLGSIDPKAKTAKDSKLVLEAYGFKFTKHRDNLDWYCKEI